jgi:DnaJ family protein C protein 28
MGNTKPTPSRLLFYRPPSAGPARLRQARDRAADYRHQDAADRDPDAAPEMDEWRDLVSKRIEEAMRRGDFDNLSGRGKPVDVSSEPFVPEDQQMAFKLLQNNDLTPDWIAERKEVLKSIEGFRAKLAAVAAQARGQWEAAADDARRHDVGMTWLRWIARWEAEIAEMNRRVMTLNLRQPSIHLEVFKLRLDEELRRAGVARKLGG